MAKTATKTHTGEAVELVQRHQAERRTLHTEAQRVEAFQAACTRLKAALAAQVTTCYAPSMRVRDAIRDMQAIVDNDPITIATYLDNPETR